MRKSKRGNARAGNATDVEVGRRIRVVRLERGMSQIELGQELGLSFQQVQKYEKGTNRISCGRLVEIAEKLETTPHQLIGWKEKDNVSLIDRETYKLARSFSGLREELRAPIRTLINTLIDGAAK